MTSLPIQEILIPQDRLQKRVSEIARQISEEYAGKSVLFIACLKGAVFFLSDLMKEMTIDVEVAFLYLSSYKGYTSPQGGVRQYMLPLPNLRDRHVILIEDILDTGNSLIYAWDYCRHFQPRSLQNCILLVKEGSEREEIPPVHYRGFDIPNVFVVGYGLDYQEKYRQLPYIAIPSL